MKASFTRSWRELAFSVPVLLSTALFLVATSALLAPILESYRAERRIDDRLRILEPVSFDLTSLERSVQAAFLKVVPKNRPTPPHLPRLSKGSMAYLRGMSLQAQAVLVDLRRQSLSLSPEERTAVTEISAGTGEYFAMLQGPSLLSSAILPAGVAATYRTLTFRLFALSYHVESQERSLSSRVAILNRSRSKKIDQLLFLLTAYSLTVLLLATSRKHTKQVLLDFAAEESEEALVLTDREGRILLHNRRFRTLSGIGEEGAEGSDLAVLFRKIPELYGAGKDWEDFLASPEAPKNFTLSFLGAHLPHLTWLLVQMGPVRFDRRPLYLEWKATDISRLKAAEIALEIHQEWLRTTLFSIGDGVITTDNGGLVTFMNNVAERLTGFSSSEARNRPIREIFPIIDEESLEERENPVGIVVRDGRIVTLDQHTSLRSRDGTLISISDSAAPIRSGTGKINGVVIVFQENTERRKAQEQIWYLTYHDTLTHLPNQRLFKQRLTNLIPWAQENQRLLAVLILDVDYFKRINDSLGHGAGDLVLTTISDRLSPFLSANDTLARNVGDEFLILLTECREITDVVHICENLLASFHRPFIVGTQEISLSASLGATIFPHDGATPEILMKNADIALHSAQDAGRKRVAFFEKKMSSGPLKDLQMEEAINQGLRRHEFFLEFQPQIETLTGKIAGAEALVRWNRPDVGRVPPDEFIPLAERTGLIVPLGAYVLRLALEQIRQWWIDGHRMTVSVNISYQHFVKPGFFEEISTILADTGVPAEALILEITESSVIKDSSLFFSIVQKLDQAGIRISIDDFGTGATALSYLTTYPIAEIKIDRSLVTNVFADIRRSELVRTIIGLGKSLEFLTVAEGVENPEEWAYLEKKSCDRIQGFFSSRPLPPKALTELLDQKFRRNASGVFGWSR